MGKHLYTAEAHVTGGRNGHGRTSDGALEVDLRVPGAEGESGTDPEQLFAVGFASCFGNAVQAVARRRKVDVGDVAIDSKVHMSTTEDRAFELAVDLDVTLPGIGDGAEAADIVAAAHSVCPYSRATRGNIEVQLTANGEKVGGGDARTEL